MARPPVTTARRHARLALMLAAERHFALHGFDGTSLSAIHDAAGQKNASATHYHFGSKEGLIDAILEYRMGPLNGRRAAQLAELEREGALPELRSLIAIWVLPLADELRRRDEGNHYLRFLDRLRRGPSQPFAARILSLQSEYRHVFALIECHLEGMPPSIRRSRLGIAAEQIVSSLAALEAEIPADPSGTDDYPAFAVNNLIDYISGGLTAPSSPETAGATGLPRTVDFHFRILDEGAI